MFDRDPQQSEGTLLEAIWMFHKLQGFISTYGPTTRGVGAWRAITAAMLLGMTLKLNEWNRAVTETKQHLRLPVHCIFQASLFYS